MALGVGGFGSPWLRVAAPCSMAGRPGMCLGLTPELRAAHGLPTASLYWHSEWDKSEDYF